MARHFTTIVFAVSGFPFWKYCLALVLSLPKQVSVAVHSAIYTTTDRRAVSCSVDPRV